MSSWRILQAHIFTWAPAIRKGHIYTPLCHMVSKFSSLIETWGITEEAVLNWSDYLLSSYRPCKQKDFFAALIFSLPVVSIVKLSWLRGINMPKPLSHSWTDMRLSKLYCLLLWPLMVKGIRGHGKWHLMLFAFCWISSGLSRYLNWNWSETFCSY